MSNVAKLVLFDAAGQILVLRRSDSHPTLSFNPDLPGGIIELDEEPAEAVARELIEETSLTITTEQVKCEASIDDGRGGQWMIFSSKIDTVAPKINLSWEHDYYRWMTVAEFLDLALIQEIDPFLEFSRSVVASL